MPSAARGLRYPTAHVRPATALTGQCPCHTVYEMLYIIPGTQGVGSPEGLLATVMNITISVI